MCTYFFDWEYGYKHIYQVYEYISTQMQWSMSTYIFTVYMDKKCWN